VRGGERKGNTIFKAPTRRNFIMKEKSSETGNVIFNEGCKRGKGGGGAPVEKTLCSILISALRGSTAQKIRGKMKSRRLYGVEYRKVKSGWGA